MPLITLNDQELPEKIWSVVLEEPYKLIHKQIPIWPIETYNEPEDLILLKVEVCGVCGSDYRYYQGENPWSQHTLGYHVNNKPNIVLGHEFAGTVIAVMNESNKKWLGKRVIPICSKTCGSCYFCKSNRPNICPNTIHLGHGQGWGDLDYYPGAYAEYVPAWGAGSFKIPSKVSFDEAAMMDILAVSNHVFNQGNYKLGLPILLIGFGPAGNGIGQVAKIMGVEDIYIVEKSELAIEIAKKNGFNSFYNLNINTLEQIKENILKLTNNHGCISIFDSVGTDQTLNFGLSLLDKGGTFVNMAVHDAKVKFNNMKISGERKITTSSNFLLKDYKEALNWLGEKKIDVKPWLTRISLSDIQSVFKKVIAGKNNEFFKVVINKFN